MDSIIKSRLERVAFADLSNFDSTTNTYHIPRYTKPTYEIGKTYIIEIPGDILNNTTSVLATNMNKNTAPKTKYIKGYVSKIAGKYIFVDSIDFNLETNTDGNFIWSGFLPANEITQIRKEK